MHLGNWQLDTVDGGAFSIDGGVTYGVVPKTLWETVTQADEKNRLRLANNCVLARDGRHTVLIDTGYGGKYEPLDRRFYEFQAGEPLMESLATLGVAPEDVDTVVLSHLHFDHAGGAARLDFQRRLVPAFPRARYAIGRLEWEDATCGAPELVTVYPMDNLTPLAEAGQIDLIEGDAEIVPGLRARLTGGHTRGHLGLLFESNRQTAFYIGDVCPTVAHLRRMWCLAYDVYPLDTRRNKPQLLGEAAEGEWLVLWPHDPHAAAGRVVRHHKREFDVVESTKRL